MDPYNGYTGTQRDKKYQEYKRLRELGQAVPAKGPCELCGDPGVEVEPHTEDYSLPYRWLPPAEYMICRFCHGWLHKRFGDGREAWMDFKSHIRRGGYGSEFASSTVRPERKQAGLSRQQGTEYEWLSKPDRVPHTGKDWWEHLTSCEESKDSLSARPRP